VLEKKGGKPIAAQKGCWKSKKNGPVAINLSPGGGFPGKFKKGGRGKKTARENIVHAAAQCYQSNGGALLRSGGRPDQKGKESQSGIPH